MFKQSLTAIILATGLIGCGGDNNELAGNSRGSISITAGALVAGTNLTASVSDADGIRNDTLVYAWSTGATGSSYTITEADEGSIISVSARYTDEKSITEGVGASTSIVMPTLDVTANIVKGPIGGANCEIFPITDTGVVSTPAQASASSDGMGVVIFTNVHFEGAGLISCSGGTYKDESTGEMRDAPVLRAVVNVVEGTADTPASSYVVSPLTEMAVQAAGSNLNAFTEQARVINARFGIRFDTTTVLPTEVGAVPLGAEGALDADRYGSVLALLSQLDADNVDKNMSVFIAEIAADLADGAFSEGLLAALERAQLNLQTVSVIANKVDVSLLNIIGSAIGYNNTPVAAIIEGTLSGTIQNTATDPLTGSVIVIDPNFGEDEIGAQTNEPLSYGTFSISAQGNWSYTVDVDNETVANLELGNSVKDTTTITSVDGTTAKIVIRIAALTQLVKISDTGNDTGEIRFSVNNLRKGKLSASFAKDETLGSDGNVKDAYITLYGSSGSASEALIDLRIQGSQTDGNGLTISPRFLVRNTESAAYPGEMITAPFVEEQFYDVEITWDLDAAEQLTLTINDEVIGGGSFSTAAVVDPDFVNLEQWFADGVKAIQFRLGDNDRTIPFGSFYVDDIAVYSDVAGTTRVFADDFESYAEGDTLDDANSPYNLAIYSEVVVFDVGDGTVEPTPAAFFDLTASTPSNATAALTGTVTVVDPDEGEAFIMPASFRSRFGDFAILEDGSWSYLLDTTNAVIAALVSGERETDSITIESFDGTTAELLITITGVGGDSGANKVAVIIDTDPSDTGELRYALGSDGPLAQGRITASVKRLDDDLGDGDAFITLFNSATNNSGAILDLRIKDDGFEVRSPSTVDTSAANVLLDAFMDIVITWEYPNGNLEVNPLVTVEVDGVSFVAEGFTPDNSSTGGVTHVSFRFGDNSGVRADTGKFTVDDLIIYSDKPGNNVVFDDNFESYAEGDSLDTDNPASPYNSASNEVVVVVE